MIEVGRSVKERVFFSGNIEDFKKSGSSGDGKEQIAVKNEGSWSLL